MIQIHKMEIIVVDFEGYGVNDFINSYRGNYTPHHFNQETVEMSQDAWDDGNPLNASNVTYEDALQEFNNRRCHFYPYKKMGEKVLVIHNKMDMKFDATPLERDGENYYGIFDVFGSITYLKESVFKKDFTIIGE